MSGSSQGHWNRDSDAPQNHPQGDTFEKGKLFGNLSCAVLYGIPNYASANSRLPDLFDPSF